MNRDGGRGRRTERSASAGNPKEFLSLCLSCPFPLYRSGYEWGCEASSKCAFCTQKPT
uniref:Uncharacterized protein n=1 Tax=Anguilla anguilla TaxID=7936 RepID=A0A0E9U559_ANGAN